MTKIYLLTLSFILLFSSCKTATKAYEKGNYINAIDLAVKKLQKHPDDGETRALLQNAYTHLINEHEGKVRLLTNSKSDARWEALYQQYITIQNLYNRIKGSPVAASIVHLVDYSGYIETYGNKAAEVHVEKGESRMRDDNRQAYREAYYEFNKALKYKRGNVDIERKRDEAYNAALVTVLIVPMDTYGFAYTNDAYTMRRFQNEVIRKLNSPSGSPFVKFYAGSDRRSSTITPDEILEMRLGSLNIGRPYDEHFTREVSTEVVVKETVYKPDSIVKEYGKVYAKITTTKQTLVSEATLFITSRDARGRILWNDQFRGEHRGQTEFVSYQGDERALSISDKALLNKRDHNLPREDEVIEALLTQVHYDLSRRLQDYYSRYN